MSDSIKLLSVKEILARFDTPNCVSNPPQYEVIRDLQKAIYRNANRISSLNGGGNRGHLGATMTPMQYATQSLIPWVNPVASPNNLAIPNDTTQSRNTTYTNNINSAATFTSFNKMSYMH
ncbi:MAG: hypothetical protein SGBAC_005090 [Bacillariaceae sp.]